MVGDSEKRFQSVMDKLFHAPKSTRNSSSSSGVKSSRGKKHPNPVPALAVVESESRGNTQQALLCRPWDRVDLMRRLATFKSMTWFAKPKVVSAVNCARRGWINVEVDTIACESCEAWMLFSTPSSWTQQQVDKAAWVFSLKLDNQHKMLCPWMDNVCDEALAQFPPTPAPVLVDGYRQRSSALLQLLALPVISSLAVDYMRSPQLEQLLAQSFALGCGNGSTDEVATECLGNEHEAAYANLYYQAQKLISLCGWEPRSLPYVVDCKYQSNQSARDANLSELSHAVCGGENRNISVYSFDTKGAMEANDSGEYEPDPNSVVLDCSLCGASVGLWTFSMVSQPIELLRLVGYTEVNGENNFAQENAISNLPGTHRTHQLGNENLVDMSDGVVKTASSNDTSSRDRLSNLSFTIAGGPLPTKQNFRATVSLPIVGQNLRARLLFDAECRGYRFSDMTCGNHEAIGSESHNNNLFVGSDDRENSVSGQAVQSESMGLSGNQSPLMNQITSEKSDALFNENNDRQISEGKTVSEPETGNEDSTMELTGQSTQNVVQDMNQNDKFPENEKHVGSFNQAVVGCTSSQVENYKHLPGTDTGRKNISFTGHQELSCTESCVETALTDLRKGGNISDVEDSSVTQLKDQNGHGIKDRLQTHVSCESASAIARNLKQIPDKAMKFDPVRQHRHFCPWIATTGSAAPGWKQTLTALQQQEFSDLTPTNSPSTASIIKVDDPLTSIRNIFMSPSAKRKKLTHGSS